MDLPLAPPCLNPQIGFLRARAIRLSLISLVAFLAVGCQGRVSQASPTPATESPPAGVASAPTASVATSVPAPPTTAPPPTVGAPAPAVEPTTGVLPAAPATFSAQRAYQDVEYLSNEIGSRAAGSPAQDRAADYLVSQFEAAGLATERQSFTFSAYDDRGSSLVVTKPEEATLTTQTLNYSPGGEIQGPLIYVDLGRDGDFEPNSVRGKVALARRGEIRFSDKVSNLAEAGAAAVVIFNNEPGIFAGSLAKLGEVPTVALSRDDGDRLLALLQRGTVTVQLKVEAEVGERIGLNVIGTKATGPSTVVIGGHYDSVRAGPGANDNASGTATFLELARVIAGREYPFTVRFIGFGAEEVGLIGSGHYVRQLSESERRQMLAMINLDMVGVGDKLSFGGDPVLVERAVRHAREVGVSAGRLGGGPGSASDHSSFQAAGVPSLFIHRGEDPNYHTAGDRAEYVVPEHLELAGRLVLAVLDDLAQNS
jgi:aminopeptidase YwaD